MVEPLKIKHHSLTGRITLSLMGEAFRAVKPNCVQRNKDKAGVDRVSIEVRTILEQAADPFFVDCFGPFGSEQIRPNQLHQKVAQRRGVQHTSIQDGCEVGHDQ